MSLYETEYGPAVADSPADITTLIRKHRQDFRRAAGERGFSLVAPDPVAHLALADWADESGYPAQAVYHRKLAAAFRTGQTVHTLTDALRRAAADRLIDYERYSNILTLAADPDGYWTDNKVIVQLPAADLARLRRRKPLPPWKNWTPDSTAPPRLTPRIREYFAQRTAERRSYRPVADFLDGPEAHLTLEYDEAVYVWDAADRDNCLLLRADLVNLIRLYVPAGAELHYCAEYTRGEAPCRYWTRPAVWFFQGRAVAALMEYDRGVQLFDL
jgi:hypothetical protein